MNNRIITYTILLMLLFNTARSQNVGTEMFDTPKVITQVLECEGGDPWGERSIPVDIDIGEESVTIPDISASGITSEIEVIPEVVPEIIVCPGVEEPIDVYLINIQKNIPKIVQLKVIDVEVIPRELKVIISDSDIVIND